MKKMVVAALLSSACASPPKRQAGASLPAWIVDTARVCPMGQLCAVGQGSELVAAEAAARQALAKMFETRIVAWAKASLELGGQEQWHKEIQESVDETLQGVVIAKRHQSEGFFALAVYDKAKGAAGLRAKMDQMDQQLRADYQDGKLAKALLSLQAREVFNRRHHFLTGRPHPPAVSFEQIRAKKVRKRGMGRTVWVALKDTRLERMITRRLLEDGHRVVSKAGRRHDIVLRAQWKREKRHLNVAGFEKHRFFFRLGSFNKNGGRIGSLDFSVAKMGRSFKQARAKAMEDVLKYVEENWDELNIEE